MQCSFLEVLIFKNLASMQHCKQKSAKWDNYKVVNFPQSVIKYFRWSSFFSEVTNALRPKETIS